MNDPKALSVSHTEKEVQPEDAKAWKQACDGYSLLFQDFGVEMYPVWSTEGGLITPPDLAEMVDDVEMAIFAIVVARYKKLGGKCTPIEALMTDEELERLEAEDIV